ncbi:response regulator [Teichococcus coralli]|uniref:hypothetical protein n=1 Tax=Teichococcus coralli TaxID=2545983 RepID=UPI001F18331D|nr:hypothetical protein [Pseudoroseomonas coralli]
MAETARQFWPNLKVLFITGQGKNAMVGSGYLAPGMRLLTKPFALEALATRIKAIISKSPRHLKIGS